MGSGRSKKGSAFERVVSKQLSLWWTHGERDDVFWRTSGSGARAKTRSKTGEKTFGQYGDVQATDPIGQPLIDWVTIEIKKGYSKNTFQDLVDAMPKQKPVFGQFIDQARTDHKNAESEWWLLISKRDQREALVTMPLILWRFLKEYKNFNIYPRALITTSKSLQIAIITFKDFLSEIEPEFFQYGR